MRIDIRTAALNSLAEPRVRLAAQLLAAFSYDARISAWDGTRCNMLIADADDAYGVRCIEQATRRGIQVLALSQTGSQGHPDVLKAPASAPAAALAKILASALGSKVSPPSETAVSGGLVLMAMVPSLAKGVFKAESGPHRILVDRQRSRVYAQSEAELRAAQNDLMLSNWDFIPALPTAAVTNDYQYSIALDAFCIVAALQNVGRFPDLPDNRYQLSDWPDIGVAGDVPHIFSLIRLLQKAPLTTSDAIAKSGMDAQEAAALLWALKASGVLKEARETSPAPAKPRPQKTLPEPGFLNKLMARFGLVASSRGA